MTDALFLNGVFEEVLEEILLAQEKNKNLTCYIQPYSDGRIKMLAEDIPSEQAPIRFYISLTTSFNTVSYTANITGWDDKRELVKDKVRLDKINTDIKKYQPTAVEVYEFSDEERTKPCVNLIHIKDLKRIKNPFSVNNLIKTSNNKQYSLRTQSGGWSRVNDSPDLIEATETYFKTNYDKELEKNIAKATKRSSVQRQKRIEKSPKKPEKITINSRGFKRNADVVAEVLERANGKCENCNNKAPFIRRKDNSPYLEVHHKITLADNGDDTVENAIAVCPNCHRELHFGI